MKFLHKSVQPDGTYTNHSIRSTVITRLDMDGFEAHHIMKLLSHKKEATIKEYTVQCPDNKCKEMFASLSNAMKPKFKKNKAQTCTLCYCFSTDRHKKRQPDGQTWKKQDATMPNIDDIKENLPNNNLEPIHTYDTIDDSVSQDLLNDNLDETAVEIATPNEFNRQVTKSFK